MCENSAQRGNVRTFPPSLEAKLGEAIKWYDERVELERQIAASSGHVNGCAERNQEDRDALDRTGGALLMEIMEEMEDAWGFAAVLKPRGKSS